MTVDESHNSDHLAQVLMPSKDLSEDLSFFTNIGFKLINIFPDDNPEVAIMRGHGIHIRIDRNIEIAPPTIHIQTDTPEEFSDDSNLSAPGGTSIKLLQKTYNVVIPPIPHAFEVRQLRDEEPWVIGRAGMQYRDLLPSRLGGGIIASHIRIPNGGPVPDMVHYHTIGFQLIFCYQGWVKLVYEDQGPPFILNAGDCVTQPPEIRHRVLEASDNLEVIEIGIPAVHMTTIDHGMELPTKDFNPERVFQGQKFCHHQRNDAVWKPWRIEGFEHRNTGIDKATNNFVSVNVARVRSPQMVVTSQHDADILFTFIMKGSVQLKADGQELKKLQKGEAFVLPPDLSYELSNMSDDLELLEVALPGNFSTKMEGNE